MYMTASIPVYSLRTQSLDVTLGLLEDDTPRASLARPPLRTPSMSGSDAPSRHPHPGRRLAARAQLELREVAQQQMRLSKESSGIASMQASGQGGSRPALGWSGRGVVHGLDARPHAMRGEAVEAYVRNRSSDIVQWLQNC